MFRDIFYSHRDRLSSKWDHYFNVYDRHLYRFVNKPVTFLEIGISKGGSLQIFKKYFGKNSLIAGIDINPESRFQEDQIITFTGDQTDTKFLDFVVSEIGTPDIIIDDGSHVQSHVLKTFNHLFPLLSESGVYIVEDCHTSYWPRFEGGLDSHLNFVDIMSRNVHDVNTKWYNLPRVANIKNLDSIHFYDSMVVFEKKPKSVERLMVNIDNNGIHVVERV